MTQPFYYKSDVQINRYERLIGKSARDITSFLKTEFKKNNQPIISNILWYKNSSSSLHTIGIPRPPTIPPFRVNHEQYQQHLTKICWFLGKYFTSQFGQNQIKEIFTYFKNLTKSGTSIFSITVPDFTNSIISEWETWLSISGEKFNLNYKEFLQLTKREPIVEQAYQLANLLLVLIPEVLGRTTKRNIFQQVYLDITTPKNPNIIYKNFHNSVHNGYIVELKPENLLYEKSPFKDLGNILSSLLTMPLYPDELLTIVQHLLDRKKPKLDEKSAVFKDIHFSGIIKPIIWKGQFQGIIYALTRGSNSSFQSFEPKDLTLFNLIINDFDFSSTIVDANKKIFAFSSLTSKEQDIHPYLLLLKNIELLTNARSYIALFNINDSKKCFFRSLPSEAKAETAIDYQSFAKLIEQSFLKRPISDFALKPNYDDRKNLFVEIKKRVPENLWKKIKANNNIVLLKLFSLKEKKLSYLILFYKELPEKVIAGHIPNEFLYAKCAEQISNDVEFGINLISGIGYNSVKYFKAELFLDSLEKACEKLKKMGKKINTSQLETVYESPLSTRKTVKRQAIEKLLKKEYKNEIIYLVKKNPNSWPLTRSLTAYKNIKRTI